MTLDSFKEKFPNAWEYFRYHADKHGLLEECTGQLALYIGIYKDMTFEDANREVNDALWEWDI